ncbi:hypothetical protein ITJ57_18930 [Plantibacter sp. VKM Ac-2880]|uniref:hypothetical protein n=1 Tax=Plantibacter sp. VKM Ac-2880 TaxID=2783827 RepID=UPI00188EB442|nr:hypothetical protein [Plantibacter sp. VKM Ac-2880]MBF4570848.1 hypothetical protein [Plantibacter sp. VKM Ac-2880]
MAIWVAAAVAAGIVVIVLGHPVWLLAVAAALLLPYFALASGFRQWTNTPQGFSAWLHR